MIINQNNDTSIWYKASISIQFNFICTVLNNNYRLKGLNRPNIYDTPLTQAPKRARENFLHWQGINLEEEQSWGSILQGMARNAVGAIIDIVYINAYRLKILNRWLGAGRLPKRVQASSRSHRNKLLIFKILVKARCQMCTPSWRQTAPSSVVCLKYGW